MVNMSSQRDFLIHIDKHRMLYIVLVLLVVLQVYRLFASVIVPENILNLGPYHRLRSYKNPCWRDPARTPPIACFPYFFLAGFPKAGTTDVYTRLMKHPEISELVEKEPHWWTRTRFERSGARYFSSYLNKFYPAVVDIQKSKDKNHVYRKIFGDCSASTLWDNSNWRIFAENAGMSEPKYTTADYIHHINPNSKFIVMIRDPVERLYSDYLYFEKNGSRLDLRVFHNAVITEIRKLHKCVEAHSLRHCAYKKATGVPRVRLAVGLYFVYIKDYLRLFPRNQMLVIKLENYSKHIRIYLKKMYHFLQLSPVDASLMDKIARLDHPVNARSARSRALGNMLPETRKLLQDFYRPFNERLDSLIGMTYDYHETHAGQSAKPVPKPDSTMNH